MELRFKVLGKVKQKYTPKDMVEYGNMIKLSFKVKYPEHLPSILGNKALIAIIDVFFKTPKVFTKKQTEEALKGLIRPTVKPDCENIAKNISYALKGNAYEDNKQIVSLHINKSYGKNDYVEISIMEF